MEFNGVQSIASWFRAMRQATLCKPSRDGHYTLDGPAALRSGDMANTVFFAWQLDTPSEHNKKFIWEALTSAAQNTTMKGRPELSPRPETDTQGVPGTPNIVQTIFKRIRACSVFVADLSFVGSTANGKQIPNPNVLIELGFAVRSIGWERTILVLNNALGRANALPFDILQHRWPIEYHVAEKTQVRDRRFETLAMALSAALNDCEQRTLSRAVEMATALDTACLDFIAHNETAPFIEMPLPAKTMGQLLTGMDQILAVRRLIDLGALDVVGEPRIGYAWTYDGNQMIGQVNRLHPGMLPVLRQHKKPNESI